jgi:stearoyl-CoA desaturase (Delta-9 desaturase)
MPVTRWERALSALSTVLFVAMHAAALLALLFPVSAQLVALAVAGYVIRMWAITAGYHRYFSHRSFKTSRAFQFCLGVVGTMAMQNGPLWWASWHRRHHRFSDTSDDTHSPVQRGFWHSHVGWFIDGSHDHPNLSNVRDLARFPELRFLDRHKWLPLVAYAGATYLVAGLPGVIWGFVISNIACLHATACINSVAHVWGTRRFETSDASRNNALLAFFTLGEGWHNNHHHDMNCARQGLVWWELDVTYYTLVVLEKLGVIWDVRAPRVAVARAGEPRKSSSSGTRPRAGFRGEGVL